jgi:hypothetical protein
MPVFTLLVTLGRAPGDGLPDDATGAGMMCYASGRDEDEAVRETAAVLRAADLNPLEIESYGSVEDRIAAGHEIDAEERALMDRAEAENAVIVAQVEHFLD